MATYRVGQRVRITKSRLGITTGCEATIIGPLQRAWDGHYYMGHAVDVDGHGRLNEYRVQMIAPVEWLAPLTDPLAEQFIERIKKLAREPAPKVEEYVTNSTEGK